MCIFNADKRPITVAAQRWTRTSFHLYALASGLTGRLDGMKLSMCGASWAHHDYSIELGHIRAYFTFYVWACSGSPRRGLKPCGRTKRGVCSSSGDSDGIPPAARSTAHRPAQPPGRVRWRERPAGAADGSGRSDGPGASEPPAMHHLQPCIIHHLSFAVCQF